MVSGVWRTKYEQILPCGWDLYFNAEKLSLSLELFTSKASRTNLYYKVFGDKLKIIIKINASERFEEKQKEKGVRIIKKLLSSKSREQASRFFFS